jgi:hypothetical protein
MDLFPSSDGGGGESTLLGPLERANLNHWATYVKVSQSYLTTDGQSASLCWCQATIRARDQFFFLHEIFFSQLRICYFVAPSERVNY